ncbi:MAG: C13 family peptidase [Candidatus Thorarchaeota archaeon]
MKRIHSKRIVLLIIFLSLFTIEINTPIKNNLVFKKKVQQEPHTAISANLGAWIIVCGDRNDHHLLGAIRNGCDETYGALVNRGFDTDDIYYLDAEFGTPSPYREAISYRVNIQDAIETWAITKVDTSHGLGIYLFDHGGTDYMCLPGTDLTKTDLNTYLNNLEISTGCRRFIIIYEACHAGSFIDAISKSDRIIVTSTDSIHGSYVNEDRTHAAFSEKFWSSIIECKTIGVAFEDAVEFVEDSIEKIQLPKIDDNHDDIGHGVGLSGHLPWLGDGDDVLNVWIGSGTNCPPVFSLWCPLRGFLNYSKFYAPMWVLVETDDYTLIDSVYARIIPPGYTPVPIETDQEGSKLGYMCELFHTVELTDPNTDGNFTADLFDPNIFTDLGDYKINIFARSKNGVISDIVSTHLTLNDDGLTPPDTTPPTISILNPSSNETLNSLTNIIVEGDDDQALDRIQIYIDNQLVKEETMPDYYPYPEVNFSLNPTGYLKGSHNITATALDKANNIKSTSINIDIGKQEIISSFRITILIISSILGIIIVFKSKFLKENLDVE